MSIEQRKNLAEAIRELYLYPYASKLKNTACGIAWLISWLVGVLFQYSSSGTDLRALASAYLIFSVSMLIEFIEEDRRHLGGILVHYSFVLAMVSMCVVSFCMLTTDFGKEIIVHSVNSPLKLLIFPQYYNCVVLARILLGMILSLLGLHKFAYDAEAEEKKKQEEIRRQQEADYEQRRKLFTDNAEGFWKGGDET